ncbi:MAG: PA0069 family radical SAM protein [Sphingobium sp.]|nr:PA0069 family radical SAM protein [Sphingobium sp.]
MIKGRGAPDNQLSTRFSLPARQEDGDWLDAMEGIDGPAPRLRTSVTVEHPRTILTRNSSPDLGMDISLNAYRGCEHGCIYCYARPSHAYHDLSPGLDFETKLFAKPDAAALLKRELSKASYRVQPILMGANTDPYQPIEADWRITRQCIEVLAECRQPLYIITKSDRVVQDIDLLAQMAVDNLVCVTLSITSLDPKITRTLEPRASHPMKRLAAVRQLREAGVPVTVNIAPVIPAITDHETEAIIEQITNAGALAAAYIVVRLPYEVAPLFRAWLAQHYPDRAGKVMSIIHDLRGGRDNDPRFHNRMKGQGVWADLMRMRFRKAIARYGLPQSWPKLRTDCFRAPQGPQYSLF